jgi:hypothetical protein
MWAVLQFSFWSGGRIAPPFPWRQWIGISGLPVHCWDSTS